MAQSKEKVQETQVSRQGGNAVVRQRTTSSSSEETRLTATNGIWLVAGFIEIILAIRLVLKMFGANPATGFVDSIYSITSPFVAPFKGIFSDPVATGDVVKSVFETGTLVAIVIYSLVAWGLVKLVHINRR